MPRRFTHYRQFLFDEDDFQSSRALISRTAANILKQEEIFGFLAPAMLDALMVTASEIEDEALKAATTSARKSWGKVPHGKVNPSKDDLVQLLETTWLLERDDPRIATIARNAEIVTSALGFSSLEREILFVRLACSADRGYSGVADKLRERLPSVGDTIACLVGADPAEVRRCLEPDAPLCRTGVVSLQPDNDTLCLALQLLDRFDIFAAERFENIDEVLRVLLGAELEAELPLTAFSHIPEADLVVRVMSGALRTGEAGVNILLYGPPGSGKTELAKSLAVTLGVSLHSVGEVDSDGGEPSRHERLEAMKLYQHLLSLRGGGVCLFDEAEDLFDTGFSLFPRRTGSKVFMNRLFEDNRVPVIWIANEVDALPRTVRRRMTLALKIDLPPSAERAAILHEIAEDAEQAFSGEDLERLMRDVPVTPGVAAKAMQATRLAEGDADTLETVTRGLAQALRDGRPIRPQPLSNVPAFDPALANADMDLSGLAERLVGASDPYSLCLSGPSGTGKSAYARYVAERMKMPARILRGSDLLGPLVGQTEQAIRAAFDTAARDGQFLILDEVDGLLNSRREAHRSFELTQVNEMLTAMEAHPLPFAVTTNLADRIDPAARRRIDFHIGFDVLNGSQARACWRHFLDGEPPRELFRLSGLTPAHFDRVRRKAILLRESDDRDALLRRLAAEVGPEATRHVGFSAPVTAH